MTAGSAYSLHALRKAYDEIVDSRRRMRRSVVTNSERWRADAAQHRYMEISAAGLAGSADDRREVIEFRVDAIRSGLGVCCDVLVPVYDRIDRTVYYASLMGNYPKKDGPEAVMSAHFRALLARAGDERFVAVPWTPETKPFFLSFPTRCISDQFDEPASGAEFGVAVAACEIAAVTCAECVLELLENRRIMRDAPDALFLAAAPPRGPSP